MDKNGILLSIITLLAGFIGGFFLANSLNRAEINAIRTVAQSPQPSNTSSGNSNTGEDLSPEEIKAKIDEADKNPTNFQFQKDLGIGLYRYGSMKQDVAILNDAARILTRANSLDAKDAGVLTNLGNAYFDIGFAKKDTGSFDKARDLYAKSLAIKDDAEVRTDLGVSYYVQPQPDYPKAIAEIQKVLTTNPRHERSLHFLAQIYTEQNKLPDAEKIVAKLKEIDPSSKDIQDLTAQIERAKGRTQ
jgi:tetratricopeptide (TPR) repeat protein